MCHATLSWTFLLTTPFVSLVGEALTYHTTFKGSSTTYHQVLSLCESPLASVASEAVGAARARAPGIEPRTGGTHAERAISHSHSRNLNLVAWGLLRCTTDVERDAVVLHESAGPLTNCATNRTPAPKHAPHQSTLKRVPPPTTKYAISIPNRFVLTRQWPQFKEGTLYTLAILLITISIAVLPCHGVLGVSLS
jgi:hypothetical protein